MDVIKSREYDKILLAALERGDTFARKGSAKMQFILKGRISLADQIIGDK
jgi:hypothetical protein